MSENHTQVSWKNRLLDLMAEDQAHQIDQFEAQIELKKQGKVDEKVFAETRLRKGAYGQRYDNGQRHDGVKTQTLSFPSNDLTKGPETMWDAPGMMRIKVPFGGLTPDQLDTLADLAEEYSDSILHVTTRQDFQLHFIHIEDTPDLMRRLAAVGITTQEACGNSVRNVTACPLAGICHDETFDVSPYAQALMRFLLGHDDCQDFGRKIKPAFSGCAGHACGLVKMHDLGYLAQTREIDGRRVRGFTFYVGGGLGAVPHEAKVLADFVSEEEMLPMTQAVLRVYTRLGEKKNRNRARLKFLVAKLGIDEFKRLVEEERKILPHDDRWTDYLKELSQFQDNPLKDAVQLNGTPKPEGYEPWSETNVYAQKQSGYATVTLNLPLGDLTSWQARRLSDIVRKYAGENMRTSVEQNILLRWVSERDLPEVFQELKAVGLSKPGAGTIVDITSCPGTDTCKLGIAASRGLGGELSERLAMKSASLPEAIKSLKIKVSGCFNSCSQHHLADLGFYGNSRKSGNYAVPHFQVVLGGKWGENGGTHGMAMGSIPSKAIPEFVDKMTDRYVDERTANESFQEWLTRLGKKGVREMVKQFTKIPDYMENPDFYTDWGDAREFTIGDMGIGECAGEVVSLFEMEITKAESEYFDAQIALDDGDAKVADELAYKAMLYAAKALVRTQYLDVGDSAEAIVKEFKSRFYDTELFFDPYAKGKFASYLLARHENGLTGDGTPTADSARGLIEETQLFIEATHACEARVAQQSQQALGL